MTAAETYKDNNFKSSEGSNNKITQSRTALKACNNSGDPPIELTENFYINNSRKRKHNLKIQVHLNCSGIVLIRETGQEGLTTEQLIRLQDIVGTYCGIKLKRRARGGLNSCKRLSDDEEEPNSLLQDQKDLSAYLYIYAYIKKEKPLSRMRTVRILRFQTFQTFEENLKSAQQWRNAIKFNKNLEEHTTMDCKPVLILLNPKSGKGKGRVMFQNQIAQVLKEAEKPYELMVTTHPNFGREFVKQRKDLTEKYSGIVVASGDGLLYEVINGIMERPDWRILVSSLPLGIIPCGSGNGLAKSIAYIYDEPFETKPIINATLTCVSGRTAPMDVVRVEVKSQRNQREMYSFLSVGWGLIADIDIESEKLRSIGSQRFTLWSIHRLMRLRTYKGKVSYLPWQQKNNSPGVTLKKPTESTEQQHSIMNGFHDVRDDETEEFADAATDDEEENISNNYADVSKKANVDSWHSATSRRTTYYSIAGQSTRSSRSIFNKIEQVNADLVGHGPQSTIPSLDEDLTEEWHTEEGEFVMVQAAYTTHLAADCLFAPQAKLNDGIIYLVIVRAGIARAQLLQFLLSMSSGTHLNETSNTHIQVTPVTAFRIQPQNEEGIITVDGERVEYGVIQAEILPGLINVMVPQGVSDQK